MRTGLKLFSVFAEIYRKIMTDQLSQNQQKRIKNFPYFYDLSVEFRKKTGWGIRLPLLSQVIVGIFSQNELETHMECDLIYLI